MFSGSECDLSWWMFHMILKRVYILLLMDEVVCRCWLYSVDWWCCWVQLPPYCFLPADGVHFWYKLLKCPIVILHTSISPVVLSVFVWQVWCSVVRFLHIKSCYVFQEKWPLHYHVMPFFVPNNFLHSEDWSVWN